MDGDGVSLLMVMIAVIGMALVCGVVVLQRTEKERVEMQEDDPNTQARIRILEAAGYRQIPQPVRSGFGGATVPSPRVQVPPINSETDLEALTVPDLKAAAADLDLPVGGNKAELVERIRGALPSVPPPPGGEDKEPDDE